VVISQIHAEMAKIIRDNPRFGAHLGGEKA